VATIELARLRLSRFGTFTEPAEIDLGGPHGLVFIGGRNEVDTKLQGNGVGKSTLFDAVTFALYGRTADGARGPDLVSWNAYGDGATLNLQLRRDGFPYTINRTIKPNSLTLQRRGDEARPVEQHVIDDLLGRNFDAYMVSAHHAQAVPSFLDLGPTAQLDLLSDLLSLDRYVRAADLAHDRTKEQQREIDDISLAIAKRRGQLIVLEDRQDEIINKETKYLRERFQFLRGVDREISSWRKQIDVLNRKLKDVTDRMAYVKEDDRLVNEYKDDAADAAHKLAVKSAESHHLRTRRAQLVRALKETLACPTCGRPFGDVGDAEKHAKKELIYIDQDLDDYAEDIRVLTDKNEAATRRFLNLSREIEDDLDKLRKDMRGYENGVANCRGSIETLQRTRADYMRRRNPYIDEAEETDERVSSIYSHLSRLKLRREEAVIHQTDLAFWVKGFKDLRLTVVETALLQLTMEVNNVLDLLGLPNWRLAVEAEGITKSGTTKRGMRIAVMVDDIERPTSRLSCGEFQRLRLAVLMGMADMVESITGTAFNIEMFDEPTAWLSPAGVAALLTVLEQRASVRGRRVYLADHRVYSHSFAETLTVVKTRDGAKLER
jgi:DNA repair exonuclease SbcCD ATPase subunit